MNFHCNRDVACAFISHVVCAVAVTSLLLVTASFAWACRSGSHAGTANTVSVTPGALLGKIAYVQAGDIWAQTLPDGTPRRLTDHAADDANDPNSHTGYARPAWSPSGEWLMLLKNKEPEVMRADGSDVRPYNVSPGVLAWSPTADRIAYTTNDGDLVVENADGADRITIATWHRTPGVDGGLSDVVWSADGEQIAYVEQRTEHGPPLVRQYVGIWRVPADASSPPAEVYTPGRPPQDGLRLLGWSPTRLLFYRDPSFTADLADGVTVEELDPVSLARPVGFSPDNPVTLVDPSLQSRDQAGDSWLITTGGGRETWTAKGVTILSPVNGTAMNITDPAVAAIQPAFSPDASRIAYAAMPDAGTDVTGAPAESALAQRKIWLTSRTGQDRQQLTSDPTYRDEYPQWSADGSQILLARLGGTGPWSLWLMPSAGGTPQKVVSRVDSTILGSDAPDWFGFYGTIAWRDVLDWWRGP